MGKRIISQARGHGSPTYRVRRRAFRFKIKFPKSLEGEATIIKLLNSPAHSAPLAKVKYNEDYFFIPACNEMIEGQKISFIGKEVKQGNISRLKDLPIKTPIYCIESIPGDGGKFIKVAGGSAIINRASPEGIYVVFPSKKEKRFDNNCRAVIGVIAGHGRKDKPIVKAGKKFYMKKATNKLWPRTSAIKMNVIDHPFGSGRGKNPKSKIAKRNAPPGARVGLIRPRRTGRR